MKTSRYIAISLAISLFVGGSSLRAETHTEKYGNDPMTESLRALKDKEFEVAFLKDMTHHHQSAVDMAELATSNTKRAELNKMGRDIISAQKAEIEEMTQWLKSWYNESPGSMDQVPGMDKMMGDMKTLEKAQGPEFDLMFLQMMIPHHEGAVSMSELVEKRSERPELHKLAQKIIKDQKAEIAEMKNWEKAWSSSANDHTDSGAHQAATSIASTIKVTVLPNEYLAAGNSVPTGIRLTGPDGKAVTLDQLKVAHTEKCHLLIVDESLSDYQHVHPEARDEPGVYWFNFKPRVGGTYHVWADVVPTATGQQEYAKTEVKVQGPPATKNKTLNTTAEADGYRFSLTTENNEPLQAGKATMVRVKVTTRDGKDFTGLEPLMGAFAHMVAFSENLESVTHVHPMGKEPEAATERGGPELSFHVEPEKPGFQKFFLQTEIGGRQVYAAFALKVQAASKSAASLAAEYTCTMHPEVVQDKPGKCPKCGMTLVKKESGR